MKVGEIEFVFVFFCMCVWFESVVEEFLMFDVIFVFFFDFFNVDRWRGVRLRSGFEI